MDKIVETIKNVWTDHKVNASVGILVFVIATIF